MKRIILSGVLFVNDRKCIGKEKAEDNIANIIIICRILYEMKKQYIK